MVEKDEGKLSQEFILSTLVSTRDSLRAVVDSARNRALSFATLVVTIAGALTAGFIFSDVGASSSVPVRILGSGGVISLLAAFISYVSAAQYTKKEARISNKISAGVEAKTAPSSRTSNSRGNAQWDTLESYLSEYNNNAQSEMAVVRNRTRYGNCFGSLALLFVVVAIIVGVVYTPRQTVKLPVSQLPADIVDLCGPSKDMIEVSIEGMNMVDKGSLVPMTIAARECPDLDGSIEVWMAKENIVVGWSRSG